MPANETRAGSISTRDERQGRVGDWVAEAFGDAHAKRPAMPNETRRRKPRGVKAWAGFVDGHFCREYITDSYGEAARSAVFANRSDAAARFQDVRCVEIKEVGRPHFRVALKSDRSRGGWARHEVGDRSRLRVVMDGTKTVTTWSALAFDIVETPIGH